MRILFVTTQFGPGYVQGTERYLATLGECLSERGHEISYLAGDPLGLNGPITDFGKRDLKSTVYAYPTRGWMAVMGASTARVSKWLKTNRPDLVHVANPAHVGVGVMAACEELAIPLVVTTMDFWWVCPKATLLRPNGSICDGTPPWSECTRCIAGDHPRHSVRRLSRLPRRMSALTLHLYYARSVLRGLAYSEVGRWTHRRELLCEQLNQVNQIIFPSRATHDAIQPMLAHARYQMIPYGLSNEWFDAPRARATSERSPEELTIGYAGALLPHKGPHLLLEAVRQLGWTHTPIRLAGGLSDSPYMSQLRELSVGLNVEFTGSLLAEAMRPFLRSLDILAMTSTWPENLPFIVLEAQAAGVPVVSSRLAGVADQIGSEKLLFEPGSVEGLAQALDYVRRSPQAVPIVKVQTVDEMTDQTEAVYRKVIPG